jgi:hypothetical protein
MGGLGAFGGFVNCAISGEFHLPHLDRHAKVWRPGWLGNVLAGCVAAVVVWGIYGPLASYDLAGTQPLEVRLTLAQLLTSLVVGLGGGRILTLESQKLILKSEKDAEREAKISLAETLKAALKNDSNDNS